MVYHGPVSIPEQPDPWHLPEQSPPSIPTDGGDAAGWLEANQPPPLQRVRRRPFRVATAWTLIALSTIAIMVMQFIATQLPPPPPTDTQPGLDTVLVGRIAVGFKQVLGQSDQGMLLSLQSQAAESPFETTALLRVAVIAGELGGSAESYERLTQLSSNNLHSVLEPASDFTTQND